uniref:Zn(2)-C6 fungal-type domain-containing protein n=1 Tax=Bionectria ochroleuca TaxID=29856 RepID=A0A8H7N0R4_BIOOC
MTKRSWNDANQGDPDHSIRWNPASFSPLPNPPTSEQAMAINHADPAQIPPLPNISRKVKACAACRKQKVRCLMDKSGPPCKRCAEKDLSCVLNKSLQTLITERVPQTNALIHDLEIVSTSVQHILKTLNLPSMPQLESSRFIAPSPVSGEQCDSNQLPDIGPSCDNSPAFSPQDEENLPRIPMHSSIHVGPHADFISQGMISLEDAEMLFHLYTDRVDHFAYGVGARYKTLEVLRCNSAVLTAAILTVAAMHDPKANSLYPICDREFKRLMTESLFDRHVDRDHLRAFGDEHRQPPGNTTREKRRRRRQFHSNLVLDIHLRSASFDLYCRQGEMREDRAIEHAEWLVESSTVTVGDQRLVSQVTLLTIIHKIRALSGTDSGKPIPTVFASHISSFSRQLDQWVGRWSTTFPEVQDGFGTFPRKGCVFHYQFAKLYLLSHVFHGLGCSPIPTEFLEAAHGATAAAMAILNIIITEPVVREALVGLPCYIQSMIGFACMFLMKLITNYGNQLIDRNEFIDILSRLVAAYQATPVNSWHLVHHMGNGLERMLRALRKQPSNTTIDPTTSDINLHRQASLDLNFSLAELGSMDMSMVNTEALFLMSGSMDMGVMGVMAIDVEQIHRQILRYIIKQTRVIKSICATSFNRDL